MSGGDPRMAVVIITHNRREELLRTLGHLTRQPERPRALVVDNGCTDGTAQAVAREYPQVDVLRAGANLGAAGRTLGVRSVDLPYVAFWDDDTWWEAGALARAADCFDAHPRLAVLTGRTLVGPANEEDAICAELRNSPLPVEPGMPGVPLLGFLAGASMVRRAAFLQAGGFDPRVNLGGEEEWLAAEFAARGWWLCYVPEVVIHHHPSERRNSRLRRSRELRNALWFAWLRRPLSSALRRTFWLTRSAPRDRVSLRAFATAIAGLPWVLRERRVLPREVERRFRILDAAQMAERSRNGRRVGGVSPLLERTIRPASAGRQPPAPANNKGPASGGRQPPVPAKHEVPVRR